MCTLTQVLDHRGPLAYLSFTHMPKGFVLSFLSVPNVDPSVRVIQSPSCFTPGQDFEAVEEVDPPSNSRSVLADDLALPTPSLPNDTPGDPALLVTGPSTKQMHH